MTPPAIPPRIPPRPIGPYNRSASWRVTTSFVYVQKIVTMTVE
jgi:hypothetical protein